MKAAVVAAVVLALGGGWATAATIDVHGLWDYGQPAVSEQRLRAALAHAGGDDALILRTQIARTYSLRRRFADAHAELDAIAPQVAAASDEVKVHALLERGRTLRSAGDALAARPLFVQAAEIGERAGLERLTGDALHMVALVEPTVDGQIAWHRRTIAHARAARDPAASGWEGAALNNLGHALREAGRLDESLSAFRDAERAYAQTKPDSEAWLIARWQVANVLRLQGRVDAALAMQLDLEARFAARGAPDPYVFEELAFLHDAKGDAVRAAAYRERHRQTSARP